MFVILFTGGSASVHAGIPPPPPGTRHPPGPGTPRDQTPPSGPGTPLPPGAGTPREQTHPLPSDQAPPDQAQSMLGDTVNARTVRILLECNLVLYLFNASRCFWLLDRNIFVKVSVIPLLKFRASCGFISLYILISLSHSS